MASWNEIVDSVQMTTNLNKLINENLKKLNKYTNRNVIVYFCAWQQKTNLPVNWAIDDYDRNGFMTVLKGMDKTKGLDLILHTPGGDLAATKSIVEYLLAFFNNDIRVIIPHTAMSAGTMIACAGKEIIMGLHSTMGPIDPQISGVPANEYLKLVEQGKTALSKNENVIYWKDVLSKYPPTFFGMCENSINLSKKYVSDWLSRNMLKGADQKDIDDTTQYLANYNYHLNHNTRLHIKELNDNTKLKITKLEQDDKLQDLVLSIFHCFTILAGSTNICKIIQSHKATTFVVQHR